ncbi:unnamed protein product [Macrosiphum euphorbiae]|uniref:RETREG1-3/ARL6IP-like N-terminal reticulon-homology domain-containing protein n=1 Tax=Macrosiphum euphorbiae TaxID=13131 RepID=A0AAV0WGL2_9HEMI|nr:unnamed protein product [Macrosiphum euphorbiae]
MAGDGSIDFQEKERISKELRVSMNEWREIIVLLNAIMSWQKNWFPAITVICVTSIYLYVWLVNCSILNMIWMTGLCAAVLDCIVCGPFQRILPPSSWDQDKERTYADISEWVADCWVTTKLYTSRFFNLRQTHTKLFHSVLSVSFFSLLYIGTTFNNMFISYITILAILLFPGFKTKSEYIEGSLQRYAHHMLSGDDDEASS